MNPVGISSLEVNESKFISDKLSVINYHRVNTSVIENYSIIEAIGCTGQSCPSHYEAFAALGTKPECAEFASFDLGPNFVQKKRQMQAKISSLMSKYRTTKQGTKTTKMPTSCPKCKMNSFLSTSR